MDLSIIIPVYQVEKYIRPCIESIFRQGLEESRFEVIIINDGTKDNSIGVIQDIVSRHSNITVVDQPNQGASVARNKGISMAKGDYLMMTDPDDVLIDGCIKELLPLAQKSGADLIVADFLELSDQQIEAFSGTFKPAFATKEKTGEELFVEDLRATECYLWRVLYKRTLITDHHITFVPGIYYQDRPFIHECYLRAGKCIRVYQPMYIYRKGHDFAASYSLTEKKAKDYLISISKTWEAQEHISLSRKAMEKLNESTFRAFSSLISRVSQEIKGRKKRNEFIDFVNKEAPTLTFHNGAKQKITTFMVRHMPHTFIQAHYLSAKIIDNRLLPFYKHKIKPLISRKK